MSLNGWAATRQAYGVKQYKFCCCWVQQNFALKIISQMNDHGGCAEGTDGNQVLPSTVGGDGARIWLFARQGAGWATATYSVLIDRIAGVFVLALIVVACLPWTFSLIHDSIARVVLLVIGFGAIAGALIFVLFGVRFRQWLDRWMLTRHLSAASRISAALCRSPRSATIVLACSVAIHLLGVTAAWCCVKAVAAPVSFAQVLFLMPPVILIATVPVSIAGWGVR